MSPKFKILDKKNIHDGFFKMNEVTLKYKKYNGDWSNEIKRELFGGAQVSAVLPYDPINKKIVLIQQFRPGTISKDNQNYLDEIVAGIIDPGETPEDTAKRECLEETGCEISNLSSIQVYCLISLVISISKFGVVLIGLISIPPLLRKFALTESSFNLHLFNKSVKILSTHSSWNPW